MDIFNLNIIDVVFVLFILCGGVVGMKRGVFKELVMTVGYLLLFVVSIFLKNPIAELLSLNLPFFNFGGGFEGIVVLNILIYQLLAFILVFAVLSVIFNIILKITKVFEKILKATIILGIPSKILGAILGVVQNLIYTFIVLYILSLPTFNLTIIKDSKVGNLILDKTPILNKIANKTLSVFNQVIELKEEFDTTTNVGEYNQKTLNIMIDSGVITEENAKKLIEKGKIKGVTIE